jgi:hypothetical protein
MGLNVINGDGADEKRLNRRLTQMAQINADGTDSTGQSRGELF